MGIFSKKEQVLPFAKTVKVLDKFAKKNGFLVLSNITFSVGDKTFSADNILLTKTGAIIFKSYDVRGKLFFNDEKGDWTHIDKDNNKTYIENPVLVAEKIAEGVRRIFAKEGVYKTEVEAYSVFVQNSDKKLEIYAPQKLPFLRLSKLAKLLKSPKCLKDKGISPENMQNAILKYKV
ncbi:MAG: NERD domain-containing protein [Oscillospiraceae bacterium]|nr:NERD domain-containing protein [Oscillospiraceae bacterium]